MNRQFWAGKRVFITGHTGFKGGWLSLWLSHFGAQVSGYALEPPTTPNLFTVAGVADLVSSTTGDVRDLSRLQAAMQQARPEVVFHLAAQSLVRESYRSPVDTYATNVMGTVHLLEAVRHCPDVRAVVNVTTDKCYENREWVWGYRENEPMGGHDPYSSSKGCAELVTAGYRRSFFNAAPGVAIATARAGNVIGGGDWAADRLLPDFLRAIDAGETLVIRSLRATRPWQHVLEPLGGYLLLAERLYADGQVYADAWNFGPAEEAARSVEWIVQWLAGLKPEVRWRCDDALQPHEAGYLKLDSSKARTLLRWAPRWDLETALGRIIEWHEAWRRGDEMRAVTLGQIDRYLQTTQGD